MRLTTEQFLDCFSEGERLLADNWRGWLVRDVEKRRWLCHEMVWAAEEEMGVHKGAEQANSDARNGMANAVCARVKARNKKCGFVIETIILAAILSWLVQRLLDWLFLNASDGAKPER